MISSLNKINQQILIIHYHYYCNYNVLVCLLFPSATENEISVSVSSFSPACKRLPISRSLRV